MDPKAVPRTDKATEYALLVLCDMLGQKAGASLGFITTVQAAQECSTNIIVERIATEGAAA